MSTNYDDPPPGYTGEQQASNEQTGVIDMQYVKGIPGILKYAEILLSLIGFICVQASGVVCVPWVAVTGYHSFVTMAAFTLTLALYVVLLLKLQKRIFRCDCVNWPLVEMTYYIGVCVFYFFGALFIAIQGCHGGHKAASAFGFFALAAFGVDLFFAVRTFLAARQAGGSAQNAGPEAGGGSSYDAQKY